jgi:hypothetical protein
LAPMFIIISLPNLKASSSHSQLTIPTLNLGRLT